MKKKIIQADKHNKKRIKYCIILTDLIFFFQSEAIKAIRTKNPPQKEEFLVANSFLENVLINGAYFSRELNIYIYKCFNMQKKKIFEEKGKIILDDGTESSMIDMEHFNFIKNNKTLKFFLDNMILFFIEHLQIKFDPKGFDGIYYSIHKEKIFEGDDFLSSFIDAISEIPVNIIPEKQKIFSEYLSKFFDDEKIKGKIKQTNGNNMKEKKNILNFFNDNKNIHKKKKTKKAEFERNIEELGDQYKISKSFSLLNSEKIWIHQNNFTENFKFFFDMIDSTIKIKCQDFVFIYLALKFLYENFKEKIEPTRECEELPFFFIHFFMKNTEEKLGEINLLKSFGKIFPYFEKKDFFENQKENFQSIVLFSFSNALHGKKNHEEIGRLRSFDTKEFFSLFILNDKEKKSNYDQLLILKENLGKLKMKDILNFNHFEKSLDGTQYSFITLMQDSPNFSILPITNQEWNFAIYLSFINFFPRIFDHFDLHELPKKKAMHLSERKNLKRQLYHLILYRLSTNDTKIFFSSKENNYKLFFDLINSIFETNLDSSVILILKLHFSFFFTQLKCAFYEIHEKFQISDNFSEEKRILGEKLAKKIKKYNKEGAKTFHKIQINFILDLKISTQMINNNNMEIQKNPKIKEKKEKKEKLHFCKINQINFINQKGAYASTLVKNLEKKKRFREASELDMLMQLNDEKTIWSILSFTPNEKIASHKDMNKKEKNVNFLMQLLEGKVSKEKIEKINRKYEENFGDGEIMIENSSEEEGEEGKQNFKKVLSSDEIEKIDQEFLKIKKKKNNHNENNNNIENLDHDKSNTTKDRVTNRVDSDQETTQSNQEKELEEKEKLFQLKTNMKNLGEKKASKISNSFHNAFSRDIVQTYEVEKTMEKISQMFFSNSLKKNLNYLVLNLELPSFRNFAEYSPLEFSLENEVNDFDSHEKNIKDQNERITENEKEIPKTLIKNCYSKIPSKGFSKTCLIIESTTLHRIQQIMILLQDKDKNKKKFEKQQEMINKTKKAKATKENHQEKEGTAHFLLNQSQIFAEKFLSDVDFDQSLSFRWLSTKFHGRTKNDNAIGELKNDFKKKINMIEFSSIQEKRHKGINEHNESIDSSSKTQSEKNGKKKKARKTLFNSPINNSQNHPNKRKMITKEITNENDEKKKFDEENQINMEKSISSLKSLSPVISYEIFDRSQISFLKFLKSEIEKKKIDNLNLDIWPLDPFLNFNLHRSQEKENQEIVEMLKIFFSKTQEIRDKATEIKMETISRNSETTIGLFWTILKKFFVIYFIIDHTKPMGEHELSLLWKNANSFLYKDNSMKESEKKKKEKEITKGDSKKNRKNIYSYRAIFGSTIEERKKYLNEKKKDINCEEFYILLEEFLLQEKIKSKKKIERFEEFHHCENTLNFLFIILGTKSFNYLIEMAKFNHLKTFLNPIKSFQKKIKRVPSINLSNSIEEPLRALLQIEQPISISDVALEELLRFINHSREKDVNFFASKIEEKIFDVIKDKFIMNEYFQNQQKNEGSAFIQNTSPYKRFYCEHEKDKNISSPVALYCKKCSMKIRSDQKKTRNQPIINGQFILNEQISMKFTNFTQKGKTIFEDLNAEPNRFSIYSFALPLIMKTKYENNDDYEYEKIKKNNQIFGNNDDSDIEDDDDDDNDEDNNDQSRLNNFQNNFQLNFNENIPPNSNCFESETISNNKNFQQNRSYENTPKSFDIIVDMKLFLLFFIFTSTLLKKNPELKKKLMNSISLIKKKQTISIPMNNFDKKIRTINNIEKQELIEQNKIIKKPFLIVDSNLFYMENMTKQKHFRSFCNLVLSFGYLNYKTKKNIQNTLGNNNIPMKSQPLIPIQKRLEELKEKFGQILTRNKKRKEIEASSQQSIKTSIGITESQINHANSQSGPEESERNRRINGKFNSTLESIETLNKLNSRLSIISRENVKTFFEIISKSNERSKKIIEMTNFFNFQNIPIPSYDPEKMGERKNMTNDNMPYLIKKKTFNYEILKNPQSPVSFSLNFDELFPIYKNIQKLYQTETKTIHQNFFFRTFMQQLDENKQSFVFDIMKSNAIQPQIKRKPRPKKRYFSIFSDELFEILNLDSLKNHSYLN